VTEQGRISADESGERAKKTDRAARWINTPPHSDTGIQLLCFPHAGGGASVFADWQARFPRGIDILPVQYSGRETRWREPLCGDMSELVRTLADDLAEFWRRPCAFLGQSFGALVAFELARAILPRGGKPLRLFLSGARAPFLPPRPAMHALPDADFIEKLREFDGLPDEILHNAELMELVLPIIRSDFRALETHCFAPHLPLPVPISVFGGLSDRTVPVPDLLAWSSLTSKAFRVRFFGGDHFFLYRSVEATAEHIAADLAASSATHHEANSREGVSHVE
jgi:medium-chain acyl-[acyl-carrier-protein] hydrolase